MPDPSMLTVTGRLTVYGYDWCEDTTRARQAFDASGVAFDYVDMDSDAAAKATIHLAEYFATPVVVTHTGAVFVEPSDDELAVISGDAVG